MAPPKWAEMKGARYHEPRVSAGQVVYAATFAPAERKTPERMAWSAHTIGARLEAQESNYDDLPSEGA